MFECENRTESQRRHYKVWKQDQAEALISLGALEAPDIIIA